MIGFFASRTGPGTNSKDCRNHLETLLTGRFFTCSKNQFRTCRPASRSRPAARCLPSPSSVGRSDHLVHGHGESGRAGRHRPIAVLRTLRRSWRGAGPAGGQLHYRLAGIRRTRLAGITGWVPPYRHQGRRRCSAMSQAGPVIACACELRCCRHSSTQSRCG